MDSETTSLASEWARGRDTIDKCDERISTIRTQGLTFLTGALTAQSLLGTSIAGSLGGAERAGLGYALLAFSFAVILAVRFFEKQSQLLQAAAASRCLVIESSQPIELTDTINDRWMRQGWPWMTLLVYLSFGLIAWVLHEYVAPQTWVLQQPTLPPECLLMLFVAALGLISWLDLQPTSVPGLDWSVDRTTAHAGDVVRVRVVNLCTHALRLPCFPAIECATTVNVPRLATSAHGDKIRAAAKAALKELKDVPREAAEKKLQALRAALPGFGADALKDSIAGALAVAADSVATSYVTAVAEVGRRARHREAGHRHHLAPSRIRQVLGAEVETTRSSAAHARAHRVDRAHDS